MGSLFPDDAEYVQAEQRVGLLRQELERHNQLYYVEARPEITDREYDRLMQELVELEHRFPELQTADSPSQKVGGEPIRGFVQAAHQVPMLSIDNLFAEQELEEWDQGLRKSLDTEQLEYSIEYKIDGVALALIYERGVLVRAVTRGNGMVGDDVTANARVIEGIPLRLLTKTAPEVLEIRGEVLILNEEFAKLQATQIQEGEEPFRNPRNAAEIGRAHV